MALGEPLGEPRQVVLPATHVLCGVFCVAPHSPQVELGDRSVAEQSESRLDRLLGQILAGRTEADADPAAAAAVERLLFAAGVPVIE